MNRRVERRLALVFVLAGVSLVLACIVARTNTFKLADADARVNHTLSVMNELQITLGLLQDIEMATRGYVISADAGYLKVVANVKNVMDSQLQHLTTLTRDNATQQEFIAKLRTLKDQQFALSDNLIQLVNTQGINAAQKAATVGKGREQMADVRQLISDMRHEEERLLTVRQDETRHRQQMGVWIISTLSALAIVLLTLSFFLIRNYLNQRRLAEAELRKNRASLLEAEKIAKIGNWILTRDGVVTWSPGLFDIYRLDPSLPPPDYEGHAHYFSPETWARLTASVSLALEKGIPYDEELEIIYPNGDRAMLKASGRVDRDAAGKIFSLHGTVQDITESRLAFEREQALTQKAQAAEQAKSHFLAMMSHEIRTPMNGVLGFADLLAQHPMPTEQMEYVHTIQESGRALLRIINDILDYSRLESGKLEIENAPFSPARLLENVRILLTSTTRFRPVEFKTDIDPALPELLVGDAGRLRQIIINLAGNSLKFTEHGSVTLGVRRGAEQTDGSQVSLEFYVRDTGIGISGDKVEQIFSPFVQADNSIARRYGGAGLGLSISEQLVKIMGGQISVASTPEVGTTFTFSTPLEVAPPGSLLAESSMEEPYDESFATHHPLNILIAEDDLINSKLVIRMLTKLGYKPRHVKTGTEAVEVFRTERPNFILMDIHMPGMNGLDATRAIRRIEEADNTLNPVYIAACTADVMPKERRTCFDYGMDDYLTKPIRQSTLADALRRATAV
ncbi:MAG: CHASE3 domain-containing protein [Chthoniobacterales bacterium]